METTLSSVKENNKCKSQLLLGIHKNDRETVDNEVRRVRRIRGFIITKKKRK